MNTQELGVYRAYLVTVEQDEWGWTATAARATKSSKPLVCWAPRVDGVLALIHASINQAVSDSPIYEDERHRRSA